jgi:hypothetical protein
MTLAEALEHVLGGGRATCDALPLGAVLKCERKGWETTGPRVVFEATGDGFDFTERLRSESEAMTWRKVEGWA